MEGEWIFSHGTKSSSCIAPFVNGLLYDMVLHPRLSSGVMLGSCVSECVCVCVAHFITGYTSRVEFEVKEQLSCSTEILLWLQVQKSVHVKKD